MDSKGIAAPGERGSEGGRPRLGGAFRYCAMSEDLLRDTTKEVRKGYTHLRRKADK